MIFEHLVLGPLQCNAAIIGDERTRDAIVLDGGDGVDEVIAALERLRLHARYLVHTHAHIDHVSDLATLKERTGATAMLHPADLPLYANLALQATWIGLTKVPRIAEVDAPLGDEQTIAIGDVNVAVRHTPGHTPGSVCFSLESAARPMLLSGDTLFAGSIGRWDLGGTSMEDIVASIRTKLLVLPDDTLVVPGHGPFTTIGRERAANPYLQL